MRSRCRIKLPLRKVVPKPVIRGIQLGLGFKLAALALCKFIPAEGGAGLLLAVICGVVVLLLLGNRRCPPAIPVVLIGLVYAFMFKLDAGVWGESFAVQLPRLKNTRTSDFSHWRGDGHCHAVETSTSSASESSRLQTCCQRG